MLRVLLARVAAGMVAGAIAVSCSHDDKAKESIASVEQAAELGGAGSGGAPAGAAGAPVEGGAGPIVGEPPGGAPGEAGAGGQGPAICIDAVCALQGPCMYCDGGACVPRPAAAQYECKAAAGECDLAEVCDGINAACPDDEKKDAGVACGDAPGPDPTCDLADTCDGSSAFCTDKKKALNAVCNPIKVGSPCDVAEVCDGQTKVCPTDDFKDQGVLCRGAAAGSESCDTPEACTGDSADCPADLPTPDGTSCLAGTSNKCATIATCAAGKCQVSATISCQPPGQCELAVNCNPGTGICEPTAKTNGTPCVDGIACTKDDKCQNGVCAHGSEDDDLCPKLPCAAVYCDVTATNFPNRCRVDAAAAKGLSCRPALTGGCDITDKCDGLSTDCPPDVHVDAGEQCLPASCGNGIGQPRIDCDGGALCPVVAAVSCDGYACDGTACRETCADSTECLPAYYCLQGVCEPRIGAGAECENDSQCTQSNPNCVDGVCCDTKCTGQCEACNVEGKEGACTAVTGEPVGDRTACAGDGSSCNGACNGTQRSSCVFKNPQTVCQDAACDAATGIAVEQAFCDGAGNCATTDAVECEPFTCGATACRGDCATDAQCTVGAFCKSGVCTTLQKPGQKCSRDAQCGSGFCTDGVCCDSRCAGQCEACGNSGACAPISGEPQGMRPACAGAEGDACAGYCDGVSASSCAYPEAAVTCRQASCDAGRATVVGHCSGAGSCSPVQTVACANGCEGSVCAGDACLVGSDCKQGERCIAGTCAPLGSEGGACSSASDCDSGFCVDGVCCNRACDGQCEACDGKSPGVCSPVSGAPHGNRAPCTSDGGACGGTCDGKDALGCNYPVGTVCSPGSCLAGQDGAEAVATVELLCNGNGRCPAPRQQACGGDGCDARNELCNGDCADGSTCPGGQYCSAGICVKNEPTGTACAANEQCASGFCVDGYCCSSACDGRCAACDVPDHLGECTPVTGSTHGGRQACQGGGACGAQCDGRSVTDCSFPDEETTCAEPYCESGVQVAASACDGGGQCRAAEQTTCAAFTCAGDLCSDACSTDADCTRTLQCREGQCVEPFKIDAVDEGTCGCRAPGSAPTSQGAWLALAGVALLAARRRRATATEVLP